MNQLIAMFFATFIAVPVWAAESLVLKTALKSEQLEKKSQLGRLQVEAVGYVSLEAQKSVNKLTVQAIGPDGKVIGQAESVTGVRETPVAIVTPNGLKTLTIVWERH